MLKSLSWGRHWNLLYQNRSTWKHVMLVIVVVSCFLSQLLSTINNLFTCLWLCDVKHNNFWKTDDYCIRNFGFVLYCREYLIIFSCLCNHTCVSQVWLMWLYLCNGWTSVRVLWPLIIWMLSIVIIQSSHLLLIDKRIAQINYT